MDRQSSEIVFDGAVYKVQTLAEDAGIRVTLDMAETDIPQAAMLMECKRAGIVLRIRATASAPAQPAETDADRPEIVGAVDMAEESALQAYGTRAEIGGALSARYQARR